MKTCKKLLALVLALVLALGMAVTAAATEGESGFDALPAGVYTYVDETPTAEAGSGKGQIQFDYLKDQMTWAFGGAGTVVTGTATLTGDGLKFLQSLYLSDRPVTDWLGGNPKNTEGYAGDVAGNVDITLTEEGKISYLYVTNPATRAVAVLARDITAPTLTVAGSTRGQPNLLQSCITLLGSSNGLYLTKQGDVILDNFAIGCGDDGVGLRGDKIGGDTFVVDTVTVDGTIEWHGLKGVITALSGRAGILLTNGQDIHMTGGSNIGRVGRSLTISTGADKGGDIIIGDAVSCDATRGGLLPNADTSTDSLAIATSGDIIAGLGNVVIGTNTEKAVLIDMIGDIQGNNVTIKPDDWGEHGKISMAIGSVTATGSIDIVVGDVNPGEVRVNISQSSVAEILSTGNTSVEVELPENPIGDLTALNGDISLTTGVITGGMGTISAPNGTVTLNVEGSTAGMVTLTVDGKAVSLKGCLIAGNYYFAMDDLIGAIPALDGTDAGVTTVIVDGESYVKLRDVCAEVNINISWSADQGIVIDTGKGA